MEGNCLNVLPHFDVEFPIVSKSIIAFSPGRPSHLIKNIQIMNNRKISFINTYKGVNIFLVAKTFVMI